MFKSFEHAESFVQDIIRETTQRKIHWEVNRYGGFIQAGCNQLSAFYMFAEQPRELILRGNGEAFDVVVSAGRNKAHAPSLEMLFQRILRQVGLLF
jgi:hypothetical protein